MTEQILLFVILSITPYNSDTMDIEVKIPQNSIEECSRTLADMEIIEGPEVSIFGTKLDINAYCYNPNPLEIKEKESIDQWMDRIYEQEKNEQEQEYKRTG